ncbi:hypothetical protein Lal_00005333 [Lupinus albus]|nr:hypothetical protein Lal_00005333 [Lupinus albus]
MTVDRLLLVADGTVQAYDGDLDDYRRYLLDRAKAERAVAKGGAERDAGPNKKDQRRAAAEARTALAPLKRKATDAETLVTKLSEEKRKIEAKMADPALYTGPGADLRRSGPLPRQPAGGAGHAGRPDPGAGRPLARHHPAGAVIADHRTGAARRLLPVRPAHRALHRADGLWPARGRTAGLAAAPLHRHPAGGADAGRRHAAAGVDRTDAEATAAPPRPHRPGALVRPAAVHPDADLHRPASADRLAAGLRAGADLAGADRARRRCHRHRAGADRGGAGVFDAGGEQPVIRRSPTSGSNSAVGPAPRNDGRGPPRPREALHEREDRDVTRPAFRILAVLPPLAGRSLGDGLHRSLLLRLAAADHPRNPPRARRGGGGVRRRHRSDHHGDAGGRRPGRPALQLRDRPRPRTPSARPLPGGHRHRRRLPQGAGPAGRGAVRQGRYGGDRHPDDHLPAGIPARGAGRHLPHPAAGRALPALQLHAAFAAEPRGAGANRGTAGLHSAKSSAGIGMGIPPRRKVIGSSARQPTTRESFHEVRLYDPLCSRRRGVAGLLREGVWAEPSLPRRDGRLWRAGHRRHHPRLRQPGTGAVASSRRLCVRQRQREAAGRGDRLGHR